MSELNDVIRQAQEGDPDAMEVLVKRFGRSIESECDKYGIWQNPELSHSDLYQEVVVRVWTKIDQFNGIKEKNTELIFDQWIRKTAKSVLSNLNRHRNAKKRNPQEAKLPFDDAAQQKFRNKETDKTASSIYRVNEDIERLNDVMDQHLDDEAKEILNLRVVEGLSLKQISERLKLTYDQVRYKYQISLAELEKRLA